MSGLGSALVSRGMAEQRLGLGDAFFSVGMAAQIGGSLIAQIGAFAAVQGQEAQLKAGATTADTQAILDDLGASQAKQAAQSVIAEGRRTKGRYALRAAQEQGAQRASTAARGIQAGVGSAAEVQASLKYAQVADELTIDSNSLRQSQALERQALSLRNRARMQRVSAQNLRDAAGALSPGLAAATQALRGLATVGGSFAQRFA